MPSYKPTACYHCKVLYVPILPEALDLCPDCARLSVATFETKCEAFNSFMRIYAEFPWDQRSMKGDAILIPPNHDFGYMSTPANALTFSSMGVDGVHDALLKIGGEVCDNSPVLQISPMDSDDHIILAPTFLDYLADGCGVPKTKIRSLLAIENHDQLVPFLDERFESGRLLDEDRARKMNARFGHLIQRKPLA